MKRVAVVFAVILASLAAAGARAQALPAPTLAAGENIRRETGTVTVNATPITVVRYVWRDSGGNPRSVALVPGSDTTSGYAVQMSYMVNEGGLRTVYLNADPAGDGGFGYFVSHELFRQFADKPDGTIAALHDEDDSPYGRNLPSTGSASSAGSQQAAHEYRLNYRRWGTVASVTDPSSTTISSAPADHQLFILPVVIRWTFIAGTDYPIWTVDYDLSAASDHIATDVRAPYGVMYFNESSPGNTAVTALRWGDKFKFAADASGSDIGAAAINPASLAWSWTASNTAGHRYDVLGAGAYELGLVDTVTWATSHFADGYADHRNSTSVATGGCGYGLQSLPCDWEWAYQSFQYDYGPPARPKIAWGTSPFLGSSISTAYIDPANDTEPLSGKGHISYGVRVVFGKAGTGTPLTLALAAAAQPADPHLVFQKAPAAGGSASYTVLGDTGGAYTTADRTWPAWSSVRFTAAPATAFRFAGWDGACAGVGRNDCMIGIDAAKTVTAHFSPLATNLDGDAHSDILYRNYSTGQVWRFLVNGFSLTSGAMAYTEPNTLWSIVADADFNGDGIADLLWRNASTGQVFLMPFAANGMPSGGAVIYTEPNAAWKIVATPDLDGDGHADILWWNSGTGQVYAMLMNGTSIAAQGLVYIEPNTSWSIVAVGDLAGSGKRNQLVWRNATTGQVFLMTVSYSGGVFSQTGQMIYAEPNTAWKIIGAPDLDGDGKSDLLWRNEGTGQVYAMLMNGGTIASQAMIYQEPNLAWKIVAMGDYNGDGKDDLLWRNDVTGQVYMMLMNGLAIANQALVYTEPNTAWHALGPWEYAQQQ